jgi:hypothetical protein
MVANILPIDPSDHQADVSSGGINPLGDGFLVGDKGYVFVEVDESDGVVKRRALTWKARASYTVDYTDAVSDTIMGFTPDSLVGTAEDGAGILAQVSGEITLPVSSEDIDADASLYWDSAENRATDTAGSEPMYIGKNKSAVADSDTELTCVLDLVPDWFNVVN